jgi:anaphase-promoting complex subunit 10
LGSWYLSSCKQGNGLNELKSEDLTKYWQSDGPPIHYLEIEFNKKYELTEIWIYLDRIADESYTPNKILLRARNFFDDLVDLLEIEIEDPHGWFKIDLDYILKGIKTKYIQVQFLSNLHFGKDTHLRGFKVFCAKSNNNSSYFQI